MRVPLRVLWTAQRRALGRKRSVFGLLVVGILSSLLVCCASVGVAEFEAYRTSFEKVYAASTDILDQFAVQERALYKRLHPARSNSFDPSKARYYSDAADPPGTEAFRRALNTVKAYNDVLYGLETGQTADALASKLANFEAQATATFIAVGGLVNTTAPVNQAALGIKAALDQALPFIKLGLTFRAREEFRLYLDQYHDAVLALLVELRNGTRVIFPTLVSELNRQPTASPKVEMYRTLLSDWVIMIDASIKALNQARAAVDAPSTIVGVVTGLTLTSQELEVAAVAARKHLAELATK